jgi:hypothetical protein
LAIDSASAFFAMREVCAGKFQASTRMGETPHSIVMVSLSIVATFMKNFRP